jgi:hypothetical protein
MKNHAQDASAPEAVNRSPLARLELGAAELAALRRQGFVAREMRGKRTTVFKLRFRFGGRQRVRYLGTDPEQAERIQRELSELQSGRRADLALGRLHRAAAQMLRDSKQRLEPWMQQAGLRFHGGAIRRPRKQSPDVSTARAAISVQLQVQRNATMKVPQGIRKTDGAGQPANEVGADDMDARLKYIKRYGRESLREPDPLRANLGVVNAELLGLALRAKEGLAAVVERRENSLEQPAHVYRGMNVYLRITSQIFRYARFVVKHGHSQTDNYLGAELSQGAKWRS